MVEGMNLSNQKHKPKKDKRVESGNNAEPEKPKRKWVPFAIAGVVLFSSGLAFNSETVMASANSAVVTIKKATGGTEFKQKDELLSQKEVKTESEAAYGRITAKWTDNKVEDVKSEIKRQKEAGLPIYVIQWGDTLSVLAKALDKSVDDLAKMNNLENDDLILTGDVLLGVLTLTEQADVDVDKQESIPIDDPAKDDANVESLDVTPKDDTNDQTHISPIDEDTINDTVINQDEPTGNVDQHVIDDENQAIVDNTKGPDVVEPNPVPNPDSDKPYIEPKPAEDFPLLEVPKPIETPDIPDNETIDGDVTVVPGEVPDEDREDYIDDGDKKPDGDTIFNTTAITYESTTPLLYGTTYVEDDTLAKGETNVVTEGENGSTKEIHKLTYYEDDNVISESIGDEVRVEPIDEVIYYGSTDKEYTTKSFSYGSPVTRITDMISTGTGQSKALEQLALSDINTKLTGMGYATEVSPEFIGIMFNTVTESFDAYNLDKQLNLGLDYVNNDQSKDHVSIESSEKGTRLTNTLSGINALQNKLGDVPLSLLTVTARGISSGPDQGQAPIALVEVRTTEQKELDVKALNKDYQDTVSAVVQAIDQHMRQVYSDGE